MTDFRCTCNDLSGECASRMTQEDLLCDACREWKSDPYNVAHGCQVGVKSEHRTIPLRRKESSFNPVQDDDDLIR